MYGTSYGPNMNALPLEGDSSRVVPPRARGGGTRDESLRESAGEAISNIVFLIN